MAREPQNPASSSSSDAAASSDAYSSCNESDFDRYCSADSVLGTASLAGSLATRSDLLDAFPDLPADDLLPPSSSATTTPHRRHQRRRRRRRSGASELAATSLGVVRRYGGGGASDPPEEEEGRSDHEEDSMLEDYGSNDSDDDDEISNDDGDLHTSAAVELYVRKVEMESRRQPPLLMDSSVAFGATDWDEFTRESEAGGFSGFSLDQDQPFQRPQTGTGSLDGAVEDMIRSYQSSAAEPSHRNGTTDRTKNTLNDSAVSATQNPPPEKDATFDGSQGDRRSCNEQITREVIDGPSEERAFDFDESAPPCTGSTGTSQEVEVADTVPPAIDASKEASFQVESIAIPNSAVGVEEIPVAGEVSVMKSCLFYLTLSFALLEYLLIRCLFIADSTLILWTLVSRVWASVP